MNKFALLFCIMGVLGASSTYAQICQRDSSLLLNDTVIISPQPYTPDNPVYGLGVACIGQPYNRSITIKVPQEFVFSGITLPLVSASIATTGAIANLPAGITYLCDPPNCVFNANTLGCILLFGTATPANNAPDTVKPVISATVNTPFIPIPIQFPGPIAPGEYRLPVHPAGASVCMSSVANPGQPLLGAVELFPNPASTHANLRVYALESADFRLEIFNLLGHRVLEQNAPLVAGENVLRIDISHLPNGAYVYSLSHPTGRLSRRLIITH